MRIIFPGRPIFIQFIPAGRAARHRLGDAVRTEDAAAVAAVVLPSVRRQGRLAVLARGHVVLVLPPNLGDKLGGYQGLYIVVLQGVPRLVCQL